MKTLRDIVGAGVPASPPVGASIPASPMVGAGVSASPPVGAGVSASPRWLPLLSRWLLFVC
ncbi:MAG: hypothetical protein NZT92_12485 [Abditibacteriales bacterium]|nr:hypothetical protein [Abditibacteriales bacterium]MDW8367559.1 hypothetical protein [Abditibacteriales bacterium]